MAGLTFEQAVSTIVGMKGEIVRALGEAFVMVGLSIMITVIFGMLLSVLLLVTSSRQLHYSKPVSFLLDSLVNLMHASPFVIPMIIMTPAIRTTVGSTIGPVTASLISSVPGLFYLTRLVEQNPRGIPEGVIEATTAMGASPLAIVRKILLNEARAGMVSSITVLAIDLPSYSMTVGMIGGDGLGDLAIRYDYYRYQAEVITFIIALLVLLAILI